MVLGSLGNTVLRLPESVYSLREFLWIVESFGVWDLTDMIRSILMDTIWKFPKIGYPNIVPQMVSPYCKDLNIRYLYTSLQNESAYLVAKSTISMISRSPKFGTLITIRVLYKSRSSHRKNWKMKASASCLVGHPSHMTKINDPEKLF